MKTALITLALLATTLAPLAEATYTGPFCSTTCSLTDGFESYPNGDTAASGGWEKGLGSQGTVSNARSHSGAQSFSIVSTPFNAGSVHRAIGPAPAKHIESDGWIALDADPGKGEAEFGFMTDEGQSSPWVGAVRFSIGGMIDYGFNGMANQVVVAPWVRNTWYEVHVAIDVPTPTTPGRATVTLVGRNVTSTSALTYSSNADIQRVAAVSLGAHAESNASSVTAWFDDVAASTGACASPAPLGDEALWLRFDPSDHDQASAGNERDASGHGRDLARNGASTSIDSPRSSDSIVYDGAHLSPVAGASGLSGDDVTITFWVKSNDTSPGGHVIFDKDIIGTTNSDWWVMWDTGNGGSARIQATFGNAGFSGVQSNDSTIANNAWHFVAVKRVRSTGMISFTVDGRAAGGGLGGTSNVQNSETLYVGGADSGERFRGSLDDIRIFGRALSDSEIASLYGCAGAPPPVPPHAVASCTSQDLHVACDGSPSSDSDGTIVSYSWSWGDGVTTTGATTNRTYAQDGTYCIVLTVTDNTGLTDSTGCVNVEVHSVPGAPPHVIATPGPGTGRALLAWQAAPTLVVAPIRDYEILRGPCGSALAPVKRVSATPTIGSPVVLFTAIDDSADAGGLLCYGVRATTIWNKTGPIANANDDLVIPSEAGVPGTSREVDVPMVVLPGIQGETIWTPNVGPTDVGTPTVTQGRTCIPGNGACTGDIIVPGVFVARTPGVESRNASTPTMTSGTAGPARGNVTFDGASATADVGVEPGTISNVTALGLVTLCPSGCALVSPQANAGAGGNASFEVGVGDLVIGREVVLP